MVAPGSQWPALSGGLRENSATNHNISDRVLAANHDVQQLLEHVDKGGKVPAAVFGVFKGRPELTADLLKNPMGEDWKKEFAELKTEIREKTLTLQKDIYAIKVVTTMALASRFSEPGPSGRVLLYVEAVRRGTTAPAHFLSAYGSTSTLGVTPSELSRDRDIIVKLGDSDGIAHFRTMRSSEIKDRAEKAKARAAIPVLTAVQFVAARELKSGDLSLTLKSARDVEAARVYR